MIQAPTSIFSRQAIMVYSIHDDESDSREDRIAHHVRINERTDTIALTSGFGVLNYSLGDNHLSSPNLNVPLGNRTVQYTQYSNFEAQRAQHMARPHPTLRPHTSPRNQDVDLNLSLDLNNPPRRTR